jgi:hypothetical protein
MALSGAGASPARAAGRHGLASRASQALDASLRASIGSARYGLDGRLTQWHDGLVPGLDPSLLPQRANADLARLRQPDSATALTVNSFLNWQQCPRLLSLAGESGFRELRFEARCPTGIRGNPPLLDLIAMSDGAVVAVTARCLEYLGQRRSKLSLGYERLRTPPGLQPWLALLNRLRDEPQAFRHIDAQTLAKHALGLGQTFPNRTIKLAYLFWEPMDGAEQEPFRGHRTELARLAAITADSVVRLTGQSFPDLWREWEGRREPEWLRGIVARLNARYGVAMADIARL